MTSLELQVLKQCVQKMLFGVILLTLFKVMHLIEIRKYVCITNFKGLAPSF